MSAVQLHGAAGGGAVSVESWESENKAHYTVQPVERIGFGLGPGFGLTHLQVQECSFPNQNNHIGYLLLIFCFVISLPFLNFDSLFYLIL